MKYEPIIGLEIHVELKTKTKMFCDSLNDPDEKHPNVNVCPVCMGHPGTLPVINKKAVESVIKTGLALGSEIPEYSKFDRKNYFYPDLPKGYQISQFDKPFCVGGKLKIGEREVRITRVHLEEDTGKLLHPEGEGCSLVDFNRAGVPLMELVTEPDMKSGEEARKFAEELQLILRYLGVSEANMERGQMRCEVNISLRPEGAEKLGTKVEIKNLNSFKAVEGGINYEIKRQTEELESGEKIVQETRGWNENKQKTFSQRGKEESHDYRYFPEPDLPPLRIMNHESRIKGENVIDLEEIKAEIPELPQQRRERFKQEYGIKNEDIEAFTADKSLGDFFEKVVSELAAWLEALRQAQGKQTEKQKIDYQSLAKLAANYIISDLQKLMKEASAKVENLLITPENFAELITLTFENKISSRVAKDVLEEMFRTGADPSHIIDEKGLSQVSDEGELEKIVDEILKNNPQAIRDFKKGKENALQFLVGQAMKETRGAANPGVARAVILKKIK